MSFVAGSAVNLDWTSIAATGTFTIALVGTGGKLIVGSIKKTIRNETNPMLEHLHGCFETRMLAYDVATRVLGERVNTMDLRLDAQGRRVDRLDWMVGALVTGHPLPSAVSVVADDAV